MLFFYLTSSYVFKDLLEVTPVSHVDRVPLQLALTQLECLAELVNLRRKESEMKTQLKYLDTQISQLTKVGFMFNNLESRTVLFGRFNSF